MPAKNSWQHSIDLHCTFGVWPFKKTLDITPNGFIWCGELIPLKKITKIRWGVDQIRGGVLPKRVCIAVFGTDKRYFVIKTRQKDFYEHLTDRYWKAVVKRLLHVICLMCLPKARNISLIIYQCQMEALQLKTGKYFQALMLNFIRGMKSNGISLTAIGVLSLRLIQNLWQVSRFCGVTMSMYSVSLLTCRCATTLALSSVLSGAR